MTTIASNNVFQGPYFSFFHSFRLHPAKGSSARTEISPKVGVRIYHASVCISLTHPLPVSDNPLDPSLVVRYRVWSSGWMGCTDDQNEPSKVYQKYLKRTMAR
jgi:hypothetical protein